MSYDYEGHPELEERQATWTRLEAGVDQLADKLGYPIDAGIKEAVVGLHAHGFETSQSCEGHDDHGDALPFVLLAVEQPDGWEESDETKAAMTAANTAQVEKMQTVLDDWYREREEQGEVLSAEQRLTLKPRGIFGAADLQPAAQECLSALPEVQRKVQAPEYRGEMRKFSAYLKERFLLGMSS